ncbi:hypothetical protein MTR67_046749 [Solanum verrucosum]|uniref:Letm1 RBD domain-containing protein n=1 Tax=Solanum verrucosum TaxID=315347 RepID=A0AAF0UX43_SOLVR|nr:hypothetical protein MTR67_046749 [Solanum verrucosum]
MASRAILRRKRNLFDSTPKPHTFIRGFSSYENWGSSKASNSWDWCSTVTHQPQNADNRNEGSSYPSTKDELLKVWGKHVLLNSSEIPALGLRVGRCGSLPTLGGRWIIHQQRYSTAAAGQPDFGKGNDKDAEPAVKQKKEASPEECDEAVEDLTMAKAKAKAKQLQDSQISIKPVLKKIWAMLLGIGPALRAVASMSREDWAKKIRHWKDEFKSTMQHYWLGTKLLWADVRICSRLLLKTAKGKSLSRRERQQLTRTTADIFRLVPVAVFIIVPFMEFLLPVFLAVFPNMLPSTFQDKMKEEARIVPIIPEALKRKLNARIEYAKFLQETVKEMAKEVKNSRSGELKNTAEDLDEFMNKVRRGASVSNEEILGFAKLFNDELTLDNISRPRLVNMCKYMGINPFGTDAYLRFMLRKRLQKIKNDDKMIQAEGVESLSEDELRQACRERGLLGLLSVEEMQQQTLSLPRGGREAVSGGPSAQVRQPK